MTKQEKHLWYDFLKAYPVHFYQQRPIDRYIVDYYCSEAGIVIELDGDQHGEETAAKYDTQRSETLQKHGLEVLRFANHDVATAFECMHVHTPSGKRTSDAKGKRRQACSFNGIGAEVGEWNVVQNLSTAMRSPSPFRGGRVLSRRYP
jgi:very-short-patch-repair endonuclease